MDPLAGTTLFLLVGLVVLFFVIMWAVPVRLWIEALSAGVTIRILTLVGMRLRKVSPPAVVRPLKKLIQFADSDGKTPLPEIKTNNEIKQLASSLSVLTSRLSGTSPEAKS